MKGTGIKTPVFKDTLFLGGFGPTVTALKASTGERRWSQEPGGCGTYFPSVGANGEVYFFGGGTIHPLHVYDGETGERGGSHFLNEVRLPELGLGQLRPPPSYHNEIVCLSGKGGTVVALADDTPEGRVVERRRNPDSIEVEYEENFVTVDDYVLEVTWNPSQDVTA